MRKVVLMFFLSMVLAASGQTIVQRKVIRSVNYGNIQLVQAITDGDTLYAINLKVANKYQKSFIVDLGSRERALHLLRAMKDVELKDEDMMSLDNATDNIVTRGLFGSLRISSEGRQFSVDVTKQQIQKFIDALEPDDAGEGKKGNKKKKNVPAYMRNFDSD